MTEEKKDKAPKAEKKAKEPKMLKVKIGDTEIEGTLLSERTIGSKKTKQVLLKIAGQGKPSQWFNKSDVVK